MNREKQIEELTNELVFTNNYGTCNAVANYLVNKGYRKQSEGEWIWKSNGYMKYLHCSCCGKQEEWETSYCPNCGAKMKGGAE